MWRQALVNVRAKVLYVGHFHLAVRQSLSNMYLCALRGCLVIYYQPTNSLSFTKCICNHLHGRLRGLRRVQSKTSVFEDLTDAVALQTEANGG